MHQYCTAFRKSTGSVPRLFPGRYLRAKVGPGVISRVYTCSQLWRSARTNRQNFTVCCCRPKWPARSLLTGLRQRLSAAQQNPSSIRVGPWLPRFPGPLEHLHRPSLSLVQVWRHFATFFWPAGGYLRPRAKTRGFHAQGGSGEVWGRKGAVQGPPIDPSDGPIAGLVERDTFFLTPLLGYGGCSKTPKIWASQAAPLSKAEYRTIKYTHQGCQNRPGTPPQLVWK